MPIFISLKGLRVGELQRNYASLGLNFSQFKLLVNEQNTDEEIRLLQHELKSLKDRRAILSKQYDLTLKELGLKKKELQRSEELHKEKVLSDADFENANAEFIQFKKQSVQTEDNLLLSQLEEERIKQRLFKLKESRGLDLNGQLFKLKELVSVLRLQMNEWGRMYLVTAEISGNISLNAEVVKHQMIDADQVIAYLLPDSEGVKTKFVRARFPVSGIGKIKVGDRAMIRVDGYPDKEYGSITSYVQSITKIPVETTDGVAEYELRFSLPTAHIKTNYNIIIPFKPNTTVTVDVITEDKSLLQRVFNQFLNLINNQV